MTTLSLASLAGGAAVLLAQGENKPEAPAQAEGKSSGKAGKSSGKSGMTSDMAIVRRQAFEITTTANGDLQARNQLELRNPLESQSTIQFIIAEGSRVKKGDLLCQLNGDSIQSQIDQETPRLASTRAAVVAAHNQYEIQVNDNASALRKAELQLELAELGLRQWEDGDVVKRRQELALDISRTELELERLAEKFRRAQELLKEGFIAKDERDQDEVAYIEAISRFKNARLAADVYESFEYAKERKQKISDVDEARAEVARVRLNNDSQVASKHADKLSQAEQLALLESRLKKLREQLDSTKIIAPQDGLVVYSTSIESGRWGGDQGSLQIGQQVWPNQLIIALPDTSVMIAAVRVHEAIAGRIKSGQSVSLKIDAAGGRVFDGTVESIGVMAESGGWRDPNLREYTVKVAMNDQGDAELKPSMRVEARLLLSKVPETLTVPVQSLFSEGAVQFVYIPEGSKFSKRPVRVGRRSETIAELVAGLDENATVLLRTPTPGEVLARDWKSDELATAGYRMTESGQIVADRPAGGASEGGGVRPAGRPTGPRADAK